MRLYDVLIKVTRLTNHEHTQDLVLLQIGWYIHLYR